MTKTLLLVCLVVNLVMSESLLLAQSVMNLPVIPNPGHLIEASSLSPMLKQMATSTIQRGQVLLGSYHSLDAVASVQQTGELPAELFAKAIIQKRHLTEELAKRDFTVRAGLIKKDVGHLFDPSAPDFARDIKRYEDAAAKVSQGTSVKLQGVSFLGIVQSTDNAVQCSLLTTYSVNKGGVEFSHFMTTSGASIRIGNDVIELIVTAPFQTKASVVQVTQVLEKWIADIFAANNR